MKIILFIIYFIPIQLIIAQPIRYPLHVGDIWQYEHGMTWYIDRDTVMPNGKSYFVIDHDCPYNPYHWVSFERKDGNQVFRYFTERDTEYLWYDFSLSSFQIVDTVPIGADTAIIRFGGCYGDSVFGHYWPTCAFLIDYRPMMTDDEEGYFIADDIGVSNWYIGPWVSYTLVGAKVDGIIYGLFTDVDNYIDISPHSFRLDQNYPNPFNPTTKIDYSLPKSVQVKIQIYDMLGRELAVLVNEKKEQGEYSVCWNVEGIQSGVYFYRIVAGEFVETKKMVVVR